jgi:hypothetical protein
MNAAKLNDSTTIPLGWLVAAIGTAVTGFLVFSGVIIWATRLEARADAMADKQSRMEIAQERYAQEQMLVQKTLIEIKILMGKKPEDRQ